MQVARRPRLPDCNERAGIARPYDPGGTGASAPELRRIAVSIATATVAEMAAHPIKMSRLAFGPSDPQVGPRSDRAALSPSLLRRLGRTSSPGAANPPPSRPFRSGAGDDRLVRLRDTKHAPGPRRLHLEFHHFTAFRTSSIRRWRGSISRPPQRAPVICVSDFTKSQLCQRHGSALLGPFPRHPLRHRHSRFPAAATPANARSAPNRDRWPTLAREGSWHPA